MNLILTETGHQLRRTKIIATLGPATDDREVLEGIIRAGADVFRLNMSHGSVEEQKARARMVREVSSGLGREVALLADLQGPKIRVERFENGGTLKDRKGLNLQGGGLSLSGIAEHDLPHITAAAEMDVDYLAVPVRQLSRALHEFRS